MLLRSDLMKYKEVTGFNLGQVEKDYIQHIFLMYLYQKQTKNMIFKGGTALQKTYGLNRFSEDLDFTLTKKTDIEKILKKVLIKLEIFGCKSVQKKIKEDTSSINFQIRGRGPLYTGQDKSQTYINLEISKREKILLDPKLNNIIPIYKDLSPYLLVTMNPSEIMSEKIRAILTRDKARDIYDLYFLIKKDFKISKKIVNEKLLYYNQRFDKKKFKKAVSKKEKIWDKELKQLTYNIPRFKNVENTIYSFNYLID